MPAPLWHFVSLVLGLVLFVSFAARGRRLFAFAHLNASPIRLFGVLIALDLLLAVYAIWGFHLGGTVSRLLGDNDGAGQLKTGDVVLGVAVGLVLLIVSIVLGELFPGGARNIAPEIAKTGSDHFMELVAYFVGAFCEEVLFRGYFLRQIAAFAENTGAAIVIQAVLFVFIHGSGQGFSGYLTRFVFGVTFGLLAVFRKSLWPSISAHMLINLTAFIVGLF